MLDELELLKKDWKKQEASLPKLSAQEIYPMLLRKSSSIVKWILIISILEFLFWIAITVLPVNPETTTFLEQNHLKVFNTVNIVIQFTGLSFFVGWFYLNYRKIQTTDSASILMRNILNTRKTVKYYIWFNLTLFALSLIIVFGFVINERPEEFKDFSTVQLVVVLSVIAIIFLLIMWLFYRVIYGILAKRLKANYKELKKLEM